MISGERAQEVQRDRASRILRFPYSWSAIAAAARRTVARLLAEQLGWTWLDARRPPWRHGTAGASGRSLPRRGKPVFATRKLLSSRSCALSPAHHRHRRRESSCGPTTANVCGQPAGSSGLPPTCRRSVAAPPGRRHHPRAAAGPDHRRAGRDRGVAASREPLYRCCADFQVDTTGRSPAEVARVILDQWQRT